jgi:signal transduction histidine kinase
MVRMFIEPIILEKDLIRRIKWLIRLRWIAATGVLIIITLSRYLLKLNLPFNYLYLGDGILFIYNTIFYFYSRRFDPQVNDPRLFKNAHRLANIQISFDLILLTYFIHFSGGAENPFSFYFIFHMVIASIILSNRAAYLQATLAVFLFGFIAVGEYAGFLKHYHLIFVHADERYILELRYFIISFVVFVTTLYITIYFATSIVNELRKGELELERLNEKLKEQDKLKSKYVQTVSHDIQASLSTIQNCLVVVVKGLTGSMSRKSEEMVARAEQRSRKLIHFVKELWNLSRMRASDEIEKKELQISVLINTIVEKHKSIVSEKDLNLKVDNCADDILIYADEYMMEELFDNVILNAIKYTQKGGGIIITCKKSESVKFIRVSVQDTGLGIPRESLPYIFDDFYRAENVKAFEKDGTGLGLSIVKYVIDLHGGNIHVNSELGKGSTFIFTLPTKP